MKINIYYVNVTKETDYYAGLELSMYNHEANRPDQNSAYMTYPHEYYAFDLHFKLKV